MLGGRVAGLPQLLPGLGQPLTGMLKKIPARYIPFAGWGASPALGAMQEPIPDLVKVSPKKDKSILPGITRKSDHMFRWSKNPISKS